MSGAEGKWVTIYVWIDGANRRKITLNGAATYETRPYTSITV